MGPTRGTKIALAVALLWSTAFLVAGLTVPVYHQGSVSSDGSRTTTVTSSSTLVEENGWPVLVVLMLPLVLSLVVAVVLLRTQRRTPAVVVGWVATGLLAVLTVLGMLTVGLFVLPASIALVVACSLDTARGGLRSGTA